MLVLAVQQYVDRLKQMDPSAAIRLSNDAWGVVLLLTMLSFLQWAINNVTNFNNLLQYCLMITLLTILIISFFSNPRRDPSRFFTSNIMFWSIFIAFLSTGIEYALVALLIGFFGLLLIYFLLCMRFPEIEDNQINLFQLVFVALIQIVLYSTIAYAAVGLPTI